MNYENLPSFRPKYKQNERIESQQVKNKTLTVDSFLLLKKDEKTFKMSLSYIPFTSTPQFTPEEPKKASCWHILTGDFLSFINDCILVNLYREPHSNA